MSTLGLVVIAMVVAGSAGLYYVKWRRTGVDEVARPTPKAAARSTGPSARFASVEIQLTAQSCKAARALAGRALLSRDAPSLPLDGCEKHCRCSFIKRSDRRQEKRRWADEGVASLVFGGRERRRPRERRTS